MNHQPSSIRTILEQRGCVVTGCAADDAAARERLPVTRMIATRYPVFNTLRRHWFHQYPLPDTFCKRPDVLGLINQLTQRGIVEQGSTASRIRYSHGSAAYLNGGWLEELAYFAMLECAPDEVVRSARLQWVQRSASGVTRTGENEIDVIARKGSALSFVSCKAQEHVPESGTVQKLSTYLYETHYWDEHFAGGLARTVLLVSTDLIDERRGNRERLPAVHARADALDVDLVGGDDLTWQNLVNRFRKHLSA